ncbi:MAG: hypothetical protein WKF86_10170 [Acidimicrobiales bacterium]
MTLVLDAGALNALERGERPMWTRLKAAKMAGDVPVTHAGVLGQVWRGSPRQAQLARALRGIKVQSLDERLGRSAGVLLGKADLSDVIDAAVVLLSADGDDIVTSDPDDLSLLAASAGRHVELIRP